ncbi:MAG: prolipoprotein diacylglyceryl transferase [Rhodospirillaceae bacterium]|nr:MAG: prolipoprotein diacylglyceryl transferase [Rhodospirillaceae bacterium]
MALSFPQIDPVLIEIGPVAIRWYALAYITGLVLGWRYMIWLAKQAGSFVKAIDADDFLTWATFAVILGGRLGYVIFYKPEFYLANPGEIIKTWQGGMSFHGGLVGVMIAAVWFTRLRKIQFLAFMDLASAVAPIGLFFGRMANFINAELWGRTTDVAWGIVFPGGGPYPRHPSQIYEALLEGLLMLVVLHLVWRRESLRSKPGVITGVFLIGYALSRMFVELFRQPDAHLGYLVGGTTMGQWLSVPMILIGLLMIKYAHKKAKA